ncbi:MAG: FlgD immunoglobulin-like domain containing protein [Candidatus Cloacimonadaceae bacterium]|nr:FlgD immunoglobulin-like domain containing protein [Candidatus Cloacimonadaceae bacterium]
MHAAGETELMIYNIRGQKIKTLQSAMQSKGEHALLWDGKDDSGKRCGSGIYIAKLKLTNKSPISRKLFLIR